jgi:hypothetical protein
MYIGMCSTYGSACVSKHEALTTYVLSTWILIWAMAERELRPQPSNESLGSEVSRSSSVSSRSISQKRSHGSLLPGSLRRSCITEDSSNKRQTTLLRYATVRTPLLSASCNAVTDVVLPFRCKECERFFKTKRGCSIHACSKFRGGLAALCASCVCTCTYASNKVYVST